MQNSTTTCTNTGLHPEDIGAERLAEKYQALVAKALLSNPVEAQDAFDARVNQYDLLMAAVPYSSIVDSTIVVKESELKTFITRKKNSSSNIRKAVISSTLMFR